MTIILHSLIVRLHQFPSKRHLDDAEAYRLMGYARLVLFILSFHQVTRLLGQNLMETKTVRSVAQTIIYSARKLPAHSTFLLRVIAGQWMLLWSGLSRPLYFRYDKERRLDEGSYLDDEKNFNLIT